MAQWSKTTKAESTSINKYNNTKAKSYKQILEKILHTITAITCLSKHTPCWVRMTLHRHTLVFTKHNQLHSPCIMNGFETIIFLQVACSTHTVASPPLPRSALLIYSAPSCQIKEGWWAQLLDMNRDLHYPQGKPAVLQNHLVNFKKSKRPFNLFFINGENKKQISLTWDFMF